MKRIVSLLLTLALVLTVLPLSVLAAPAVSNRFFRDVEIVDGVIDVGDDYVSEWCEVSGAVSFTVDITDSGVVDLNALLAARDAPSGTYHVAVYGTNYTMVPELLVVTLFDGDYVYSTKPYVNPFLDVQEGAWYHEAVMWAFFHDPQITNGTSDDMFSPNATCTRAQIVTFLWRAKGCPGQTTSVSPFKDVQNPTAYYYKAVLWAVENGVTAGTSADTFSPNKGCTRAQAVTFLWRADGEPAPTSTANPFTDVPAGQYYTDAVLWAVDKGVTTGVSETSFSPDALCTRAQIVTFLFRDLDE